MSAHRRATRADRRRGSADALVAWLIGPAFIALAAWFLFGPGPQRPDDPKPRPAGRVVTDPPRVPISDPPTLQVAGFTKKCTECHDLFRSNPEQALILSQHRNIVQQHGMNDLCFNCHDTTDRARLVLPKGRTASFAESHLLCAKCHGTAYRDWEMGMHGRTNGSWMKDAVAFDRLTCVQCHDPHAPAFENMPSWPAPRTLRMGDGVPPASEKHGKHNPLRRWSGGSDEEGDS